MATITMQRDLVIMLKKETFLNVGILSKLHPMPSELARQIFKDNALEKLTQNVFNHLAYYLVSIIDPQASAALPWPLYDTKAERTYRNELSIFISDYSSKGLVAPVMSSYLVNPGCYKVTYLIFQLSQLAVQRVLLSKMSKDRQKKLYTDMTEKYKSKNADGFIECIEKETEIMLSKFSNYLRKRDAIEKIADMFRKKILVLEETLASMKAQEYIDDIVDGFIKKNMVGEESKAEILNIKNVHKPAKFFDNWLAETDKKIEQFEREWEAKVSPFLQTCKQTVENTEALIARHTGEAQKHTFTVEYNPKTDDICTKDLQNQVNSQQKYILKNIIRDDKLNFPNLIRGFLISICFVLKNAEIGDEIYRFNEYLGNGQTNYKEIISALGILVERVMNADARLQPQQETFNDSSSVREIFEIPPLPDLSDLKMNREFHPQVLFDPFTPVNYTKHQFNLRRKVTGSFSKPMPKSLLITPFHHGPRDDFLKSVISCRVSAYDRPNTAQNLHNMSVISQITNRGNETITECASGFTKQQINRLLSTKKSSSSKKFKKKMERPDIKVKKGGLFNESNISNESVVLFRSHSSPNLFENRDKRSLSRGRQRKLSVMKEDSPSLLEMSGIAAIERDSNHSTPQEIAHLKNSRKLIDASSLPSITVTPTEPRSDSRNIEDNSRKIEVDLNIEINNISIEVQTVLPERKSVETSEKDLKAETPKPNANLIRKTSSLEKIINRFKKVRASVLPSEPRIEDEVEIRTMVEEKENLNSVNVDVFTANRVLLPDLLSPSCSMLNQKSSEYLEELWIDSDEEKPRRTRESLGTALGVDHTFLDQFDLID